MILKISKFVSKTGRFGSRILVSNWTLRNRYSIYAKSLSKFLVSPINFFKGVIRFSASFESVKVQVFYFFQKFYSSDVGSLVAWFNIQKLKKSSHFHKSINKRKETFYSDTNRPISFRIISFSFLRKYQLKDRLYIIVSLNKNGQGLALFSGNLADDYFPAVNLNQVGNEPKWTARIWIAQCKRLKWTATVKWAVIWDRPSQAKITTFFEERSEFKILLN